MRGWESREGWPAPCLSPQVSRLAAVALSCAALGLIFWGLHQLDMPAIRFMRSVHRPGLEEAGDWLARLGSGALLAGFSAALLIVGRWRMQPEFFHAGLQGLLAHGAAALVSQLLKHTIGRPRPRVTHEGEFQFEPSMAGGFDSFPSGHAAASFAVATVLARHFPRFGWVGYLAASLVVCSRVWRGSHFPTDVAAGVIVGVLSGTLLAYSYMDRLRVVSCALTRSTLALAAVFTFLWPMVQSASEQQGALWPTGVGLAAILVGLGVRWKMAFSGKPVAAGPWPALLIGVGLTFSTGSWLVSAVALMAGPAWIVSQAETRDRSGLSGAPAQCSCNPWREAALGFSLVLSFAVLQSVKGLLPIL